MKKQQRTFRRFLKRPLVLSIVLVFTSTLFFLLYKPHKAHAQIFLTSGTSWTVPSDWSNTNNTIEVIGGGGGGGGGFTDLSGSGGGGGGGGGAGGYARTTNVTLSPGATVTVAIGAAGSSGPDSTSGGGGGDTYLCNSTTNCSSITDTAVIVGAKGGSGGVTGTSTTGGAGGSGGQASSGVGSTKFNGGTGGTSGSTGSGSGSGGGGGAGAAGLNAAGNNGNANTSTTVGGSGGQGDGSNGGSGGGASGGSGGNGTEYDSTHGSGGGGGGGNGISNGSGSPGGAGGTYGSAGGGGGGNGSKHGNGAAGAAGVQGLIRINYTFTSENSYRWRSDDGNETTGTSLASQDTPASINYGNNVRLRVALSNVGSSTTFSYRLEYAPYTTECGSWTAIPATATTEHFNIYNSANITDQGATTNAASGPAVVTDPAGYSFTAGKFVNNTSNTATSQTIGAGNFTELEYAVQPNSNATFATYCFRVTTSAGTPLDNYDTYPVLNINYPPSAPTIYSVKNATTGVSRLPTYQLRSYDLNRDYLRYSVEVCPANSWPCATGGQTYTQTAGDQTCWSGQDAQTATAYSARTSEPVSTMAYCATTTANILNPSTTYYMRARAIDPGGTNSYGTYSSVVSFTTGSLFVNIIGNTNISGNTIIGN